MVGVSLSHVGHSLAFLHDVRTQRPLPVKLELRGPDCHQSGPVDVSVVCQQLGFVNIEVLIVVGLWIWDTRGLIRVLIRSLLRIFIRSDLILILAPEKHHHCQNS